MEEKDITQNAAQTETTAGGAGKSKWGGYRAGSGRKSLLGAKKTVAVRLPPDLYAFMQMQTNKSAVIEAALRLYVETKGINLS